MPDRDRLNTKMILETYAQLLNYKGKITYIGPTLRNKKNERQTTLTIIRGLITYIGPTLRNKKMKDKLLLR